MRPPNSDGVSRMPHTSRRPRASSGRRSPARAPRTPRPPQAAPHAELDRALDAAAAASPPAAPGPRREKTPRGLVLVPTRELAQQVADVLVPLGRAVGVSIATVYGGVSISAQISRVRHADIVVPTPRCTR